MRMEMLTDDEEKVIDALRLVANAQHQIQRTAAQEDMRAELNSIYHDLATIDSTYWEETVQNIALRIHNLLY